MADIEKRRFPRLLMNVEVEYAVAGIEDAELYTTGSKNVSEGGICVIVFEKVACGTIVNLKFEMPEWNRFITAKGKIAWMRELTFDKNQSCDMYEAGIEFVEINPEDRRKINEYIISKITPPIPPGP